MTKRYGVLALLILTLCSTISAQQERKDIFVFPKKKKVEQTKKKEFKINQEALKALNLGGPLERSTPSNSLQPIGVKELTDKILGKKPLHDDSNEGRMMLGMSCFDMKYIPMRQSRGMVLSRRAMAPRYRAMDNVTSKYGPTQKAGISFSMEDLLQSIFHKDPPKLWLKYNTASQLAVNVETEMPDSLVRIRQASFAMVDSLITTSQKKYKIVYLFCEEDDYTKSNFTEVAKLVASRASEFDLFPVSGKETKEIYCIAKYLKKNAYFSPVYVMSGKNKEKLLLMLDKENQAISLMACDVNTAKKLEELKRLP